MIPSIVFNGVSSESLGVIVTRLPDFHRASRRIVEKTIPGRHGALIQDEGAYDLYTTILEVNLNGASQRDVYAWLRGEGWLITSDEPDYKAYVYAYNSVTDERFRVPEGAYDTLSIDLRVEPFLRLVEEEPLAFSSNSAFLGQGHAESAPLIRIDGSGDGTLMVNGETAHLTGIDGSLYIDCEAGVAYTLAEGVPVFAGGKVELEGGEWPAFKGEGEYNLVSWTGDITGVWIQPNWRFL